MAYNQEIVTDLLRGKLGYTGVVNSDTGITTGMPWGVETLSVKERYRKAIEAGVDRLGGDATPGDRRRAGEGRAPSPEARIDESARRILRVLFALGLFENPYANPEEAARTVRKAEFQQKADLAQRKSIVLLKNAGDLLPAEEGRPHVRRGHRRRGGRALRLRLDRRPRGRGRVHPARLRRPRRPRPRPARAAAPPHRPDPARGDARPRARRSCGRSRPSSRCTSTTRSSSPSSRARRGALLATFGVSDEALLDVLFGKFAPTGQLPVRDALLDGRRARAARGRAPRLEGPALPDRVRADLSVREVRPGEPRCPSSRPTGWLSTGSRPTTPRSSSSC